MGLSIFRVREFTKNRAEGFDFADKKLAVEGGVEAEDVSLGGASNAVKIDLESPFSTIAATRLWEEEQFKQFCKKYGVRLKSA